MKDYNSPEAVAQRTNQEDPIVMYLIVRESLGISIGKIGAQCAHASQMLQLKYNQFEKVVTNFDCLENIGVPPSFEEKKEFDLVNSQYVIFNKWLDSSFRKVVLRADDKEWAKLKETFKDNMVVVIDAGLTELEPGSETVIGLWPMYKSQAPKLLKRLQVLK